MSYFTHIDDVGVWVWGSDAADPLRKAKEVQLEPRGFSVLIHMEEVWLLLDIVGIRSGREKDETRNLAAEIVETTVETIVVVISEVSLRSGCRSPPADNE